MTDPFTNPLKVAVFGNSVGLLVAGRCGSKGPYFSYPAALARCTSRGVGFDVDNHCRIAGIVTEASGAWLNPLARTRPDIVVLQFGGYEAFPRWVPRRVTSALMGISRHSGRLRGRYWHAATRLLALLSKWECALDEYTPMHLGGYLSLKRFEAELRHVCKRIRAQLGCRIVLMDTHAPARRAPVQTKNVFARIEANNRAIYRVASELGLEVFSLAALVDEMGRDKVLGDGVHLHREAHLRVGQELADFLTRPFA